MNKLIKLVFIVLVIVMCVVACISCTNNQKENEETYDGVKYTASVENAKLGKMPFSAQIEVEFYLIDETNYKTVSSCTVLGTTETCEEVGSIDFENLTITPKDSDVIDAAISNITKDDDGKIISFTLNFFAAERNDKQFRLDTEFKLA